LRRSLGVTRLTRVAVCRRELDLDTSAVAVPVFGPGGSVIAALELEVQDPRDLRQMQPPLVVAARTLSRDLATSRGVGCVVRPPPASQVACSASTMPGYSVRMPHQDAVNH
jgi:hypothetical protein